ncbi:MAG: hypothetical protein Kow0037_10210 [Calditrichia bacterium]
MSEQFEKVKGYLLDMDLKITDENPEEELVVVEDPENGIQNLVIDCEAPIVVLEQLIFEVKKDDARIYKRLLQMNRELVHGAFVMDEEGKYVFYRDTLQLENLDYNELEASIHSLSLALAENGAELLEFAKN